MSRIAIFRLAAVALLLLTGAELFACEILTPDNCESFGFPGGGSPEKPDDGCICCCTHIVVVSPMTLTPRAERVSTVVLVELWTPTRESSAIYHPPRV